MSWVETMRRRWYAPRLPASRVIRESADELLSREDAGWILLGRGFQGGEPEPQTRIKLVERARRYWHLDPLCKHAVRLWTDYALGTGLGFQCRDAAVQKTLRSFWSLPRNKPVFSAQGQRKSSHRLLIDGEIFFALAGESPELIVRRVDPMEIVRFLCDPEDAERVLFYRRDYVPAGALAMRTAYYRALEAMDAEDLPEVIDDGRVINDLAEKDVCLLHVALDPLGQRGNSLLSTVVGWADQHGQFMEDRLAMYSQTAKTAKIAKAALAILAVQSFQLVGLRNCLRLNSAG